MAIVKVAFEGAAHVFKISKKRKDGYDVICERCNLEGFNPSGSDFVEVKHSRKNAEQVDKCKLDEPTENIHDFTPIEDNTEPVKEHEKKVYLQYTFSDPELKDFSKKQAYEYATLENLEAEKKAVVADYGQKIAQAKQSISALSKFINNGFDYRYIDCIIKYHEPANDNKTIIRKDTGEVVEVKPMTDADYTLFNQVQD